MTSLRNQLRPKHQVLVLKCYPRFLKNTPDVKPNSSELSYLLYYASTRRSKIQKVGAFLEKKTEADVRKGRISNVQVTLQILASLIDRTRRDLTLYAPYVLRILQNVLDSKDLSLAEDSVPTFQAFCEHQDAATFAADQYLVRLYETAVRTYAGFAQKEAPGRGQISRPASFRWRTVGLKAIRSITRSEAISVDNGQQLKTIIPPILQNLHDESEDYLLSLIAKADSQEYLDRDPAKGRASIATQNTSEEAQTTEATTEEADRLAEEEVGVLALQCLKNIFSATGRGQIRIATQAMLAHFLGVVKPSGAQRNPSSKSPSTSRSVPIGSWATAVTQMVARWTPVQDRFAIMVTTMEELVKSPIAEENLEQQLVLVTLVHSLLSSSINMIGLSIMDVLLGLVQHILLVLQLGGKGSSILPHRQQTDAVELFATDKDMHETQVVESPVPTESAAARDSQKPSATRRHVLDRLRACCGALANHVYYSDQVSDMISAILLRLKPSPLSQVADPIVAVENPEAAAQAISTSVNMQEDPRTDKFFSFGTARMTALDAIKEILVVANSKASVTGASAVGRNRVQVHTWEGTQWLLRDEDHRVRRAYVDALITWLTLELSKNDLGVLDDRQTRRTKTEPKSGNEPVRAVSSASRRSKASRAPKSTFLQLLHLAIYDNAIEAPEDEPEVLLLHLLLYHLVARLGVNSVQHGLPMILRLQEDINLLEAIGTPKSKIVIGSLVHGYFWALLDQFSIGKSTVADKIIQEIDRRKAHGLWLKAVECPALSLEKLGVASVASKLKSIDSTVTTQEALIPFDDIPDLVSKIAIAYNASLASPPSSPPGSPGKTFASPILGSVTTFRSRELPDEIRDRMLETWTKASCLSSIQAELTRTASLHGSQRGTLRSLRKNGFLQAEGTPPRDTSPGSDQLPLPSHRSGKRGLAASIQTSAARASMPVDVPHSHTLGGDFRMSNGHANGRSTMRFEDLKRVLDRSNSAIGRRTSLPDNEVPAAFGAFSHSDRPRASMSVDSESMMDAEGLDMSEDEGNGRGVRLSSMTSNPQTRQRVLSGASAEKNRTRSSSTASIEDPNANARALKGEIVPAVIRNDEDIDPDRIPPVPPLPEGLIGRVNVARPALSDLAGGAKNDVGKDGSDKPQTGDRRSNAAKLLSSIDIGDGDRLQESNVGRPPY